ncbi:putative membrane protein [Pseudomonas sp. R1-43-08]|uniref:DUF962 domain-containing protein n=1 Tax=Pseudomonas sp. R1-43-08 TaxID=1173270 RepID=UPI000F70A8EA|nr:DUF962 domain-containing protein [Pseudomonas sp. R1-43-08]AZF43381.1 putative membrane protein [Pseudomonas sp. R1-43-08]
MTAPVKFNNFRAFYSFYLSEHSDRTSRRLHFIGSTIAILLTIVAVLTGSGWMLILAMVQAYTFAWVGHFFYERNRPATFNHPINSFIGDWRMWWDILTGRIPF